MVKIPGSKVTSHALQEMGVAAPPNCTTLCNTVSHNPMNPPFTDLRSDCTCSTREKETTMFVSVLVKGLD